VRSTDPLHQGRGNIISNKEFHFLDGRGRHEVSGEGDAPFPSRRNKVTFKRAERIFKDQDRQKKLDV
jgi:hypothetical protein